MLKLKRRRRILATYIIIDIVTVVLLLIFAIVGTVRGFAKTFISSFGTILSLIFAVLLCSLVATFMEQSFGLISAISNKANEILSGQISQVVLNSPIETVTYEVMNNEGVPGWIISIVMVLKANSSIPNGTSISGVICPAIGYYIACALAILVLFIIFQIIFFIVGKIIEKSKEFVLIDAVDKSLGFVLGLVKGLIVVWVIIAIINIIPLTFVQDIAANIKLAPVSNFINNINLIGIIMSAITDPKNIVQFISQSI